MMNRVKDGMSKRDRDERENGKGILRGVSASDARISCC